MTTVIGLSGYARSGKDTVGTHLVEQHGFTRLAFAERLRSAARALDPFVSIPLRLAIRWRVWPTVRLSHVLRKVGYDEAKKAPDVRRTYQRLGTEMGRLTFWEDFWVDLVRREIETNPDGRYVITDCRFPNEAAMVADLGGQVWRIERFGTGATNAHPSETALDDWDFDATFINDGTVEDLLSLVDTVAVSRALTST